VLDLDNDIYEEVVKPLLEKCKFDVEPSFSVPPSLDSPLEKRALVNFDYE